MAGRVALRPGLQHYPDRMGGAQENPRDAAQFKPLPVLRFRHGIVPLFLAPTGRSERLPNLPPMPARVGLRVPGVMAQAMRYATSAASRW